MKFKVERHVKCTVWVKEQGDIEADSLMDAEAKLKKSFNETRSSILVETLEEITEKEHAKECHGAGGNQPTNKKGNNGEDNFFFF